MGFTDAAVFFLLKSKENLVVLGGLNLLLLCRIFLNMPGGSTNQTIQELQHLQSARPLSQKADFLGGVKVPLFFRYRHAVL